MKLSNFRNVENSVKLLSNLDKQIIKAKIYLDDLVEDDEQNDSECIFSGGWGGKVSEYMDQSGNNINLDGCYVTREVVSSTLDILVNKRDTVLDWLVSNGVDVGERD